jgi:DNA-binding IclR family transcriptional regulator
MLQTVSRAIQCLQTLAAHAEGLSLTELAKSIGSNKATVFRIVKTLQQFDLITSFPENNRLRLGSGILALTRGLASESAIRELAHPHLMWLREQTGETACLHLVFGYGRACVDQVESRASLKWVAEIGKRFPLTAGAPGKAILAFLPSDEQERVLRLVPLTRLTPNSVIDQREFRRVLKQTHRDGYAVSFNESVQGAAACGAPIYDGAGKVIGAITVAGPVERLSHGQLKRFSPLVKREAAALSHELRDGHRA